MDAPDLSLRYDDHADAVIDLHLPTRSIGSVVLVHGGFWKQRWDRTHTRPMARALADLGYVVATPEYRRVGGGGGWPLTWQDVERAIASLPALCTEAPWGPPVVIGHSAGGHLALLLAASPLAISGVVALAPVADLRAALDLRLGSDAAAAFLGQDPSAIDDADPLHQPPLRGRRVEIVHGTRDEDVPIFLSRTYAATHRDVVLTELGCAHFELIEPGSTAWPAVVRAIDTAT